jgi:hypothetical protein
LVAPREKKNSSFLGHFWYSAAFVPSPSNHILEFRETAAAFGEELG